MQVQTKAVIYLASQRGCSQSESYRGYHTFNSGTYFNEYKKPFGNLQAINDYTLKGGSTLTIKVSIDSTVLLLPLVGGMNYRTRDALPGTLEPGQAQILCLLKNSEIEISNPFENELINFIQIGLTPVPAQVQQETSRFEFDLNLNKNCLLPFGSSPAETDPQALGYIGKFEGRKEGSCIVRNPNLGVFVFVIEGALEVQNRLLQSRDGLGLWGTEEVVFEALSNDAIVLFVRF
jgi:quercetin 2,3-dioxygenase